MSAYIRAMISRGDTREGSCRAENTTTRASKQIATTKSQTEKSNEASSDTDFARDEERERKAARSITTMTDIGHLAAKPIAIAPFK